MRTVKIVFVLFLLSLCTTSCRRSHNEIWEDTRTAGRHVGRGFRSMGGKHGDSRQVISRDEFSPKDDMYFQNCECEFVPLHDMEGHPMISMENARQPEQTPGDPGSSIPGIEAFQDPSRNPRLASIFRNVQFDLNSNLVRGQQNLDTIRNICEYMKRNPSCYVFVEGHCCERGPAAFNLALGSQRANAVRNLMVKEGVNPDRVFTISYGKERPLVPVTDEESIAINRRAQFRIYER